jgi:DUF1680 family protein
MPQVATDYRINTYLRDEHGVYVNLYIPSTVRWQQEGAQVELTQKSDYPYDSQVQLEVKTSKAKSFAINLRVPTWAEGASVAVKGKREAVSAGSFARIERKWKSGDRIELELPMKIRLEAIDAHHPDTVAAICGPLVLFGEQVPGLTREHLLAAKRMTKEVWQASPDGSPVVKMLPWAALREDEPYTTYLKVG